MRFTRIALALSGIVPSSIARLVRPNEPYEGFVHNGNVTTHFRAMGQGPLMVLVHGFPDNSKTWDLQMKEFSKEYTVVCPTLRGYPPSDVPEDPALYPLSIVAGDFLAILDHFQADKAIVGGHDFGGAAIQALALTYPERILGLIMMNTPVFPVFNDLVNFNKEQQNLSAYTIPYIQYQPGNDKDTNTIVQYIRNEEYRNEIKAYLDSSSVVGMFNYYKVNFPAPPYGQVTELPSVLYQIPTLILWGVEEEYFSSKMLDGIMRFFTNYARIVFIQNAGHWVFRDQAEVVNEEIWSWLEKVKINGN